MMRRWSKVAIAAGAAAGAAAAFNAWSRWNVGPVGRVVDGEPHFYQWREGAVYYEVAGRADAPRLLLVHGINAAASSFEMRKIFGPLSQNFRVYLPDALGYGRSERPGIRYASDTLVDLWSDFVRDVAGAGGQPVHVIASSLSAAHVLSAAARHPERFGRLLLICPTGIQALSQPPRLAGRLLQAFLRSPVFGTAAFNLLVSRPSLAGFLKRQAYADPASLANDDLEIYYTTGHQAGAKWLPAAFVSGALNRSIAGDLTRLPNPVSLAWGARARITPAQHSEAFRSLKPGMPVRIFDRSALLPHDEEPEAFVQWARQALAP
jgi:pimeloyl-ACP methyl ester carboxylesterase